ncbi:methionyl-tRNA formyltransferase [Pseudonocardia sp. H11422]|uniref:methionyl-tRNA formyltransferase n=1 Tax=Pseudonocardia sp. H11422 TaxID=2835866 RepID=UPI001BDC11EB|nr:formyltransferase family protein [Pseudonocardia sp. H11422]
MKIVLVAEEAAGIQALRTISATSHRLHTVLTSTWACEETGRGVTVASVARDLGVPTLPAALVSDPGFAGVLSRYEVDVLLNVHSLRLIDAAVLAAPRVGCFNLHPGPLPSYAGMNVPSWAVYHGEASHAVTLHWMSPTVDAGAIAHSARFPLTEDDTGLSVSAACVRWGIPLIGRLLAGLAADPVDIPAVEQDLSMRRYFHRQVPHEGWIPWRAPARRVLGLVRACDFGPWLSPWGRPRARRGDTEIEICRARATGEPTSSPPGTVAACDGVEARIAAGDEWVLVRRLRVDGAAVAPNEVLTLGDVLNTPLTPAFV